MLFLGTLILAATLAAPLPQGCGSTGSSQGGHGGHGAAPSRQRQPDPDRPKVHAINSICPVMGQPVKPGRDREVVIRGNYYLVCCDGCGPDMADNPDKYLDKEGRPKNTPKDSDESKSRESVAPVKPATSEHKH